MSVLPVKITNCVFSVGNLRTEVDFKVKDVPVPGDQLAWRRGYWQDPTWRRPPLEPGKANETLRKYREQLRLFRDNASLIQKRKRTFDDLLARDEARLEKAKVRDRAKRLSGL